MRIESFILGELGQASERAVPDLDDTNLRVPATLVPTVECPRAVDLGTDTTLRSSAMRTMVSRVLNGADSIQPFVTLTKGIWRINLEQNYSSNYQSTGATDGDGFLRMTLDGSFTIELAGFYAHTSPGSQVRSTTWVLNVRGNLVIDQFLRGNGVGQEHRLYTVLLASKML